ncbi:MAG TPA: CopD family protein, partial [Acidimicrobiales bacterium]
PRVALQFDEEVDTALGGITVSDASGKAVASGGEQPDRSRVVLALPSLAEGAYVVVYNVTSLDGHPVRGGFTFEVGKGGADTAGLLEDALAGSGSDGLVKTLVAVSRWLSFVALAALVGGALFLHLWPSGASCWPGRRVVWLGWAFSVVGAAGGWMLLGPYLTGGSLGSITDFGLWRQVYGSPAAKATFARLVVLVVGGMALPLWLHRAAQRAYLALIGVVTLAAAATFALAGHSRTGRFPVLGVSLDVAHVSAMALWLGGLMVLAAVALQPEARETVDATDEGGDAAEQADGRAEPRVEPQPVGAAVAPVPEVTVEQAVGRFSAFAFGAVVVIVVTGVLQGWRILDGLDSLRGTTYGSLLIAKVVLVVAIVLVAWVARRAVRMGRGAERSLRQVVGIEVAVAAVVLALTAALTATSPSVAREADTFSTTLVQGNVISNLVIDPAAVGTSVLHLVVTVPGGSLAPSQSADVRLLLPERNLGPLAVALEDAGPNHWIGPAVQLPYAGEWTAEIRIVTFDGKLVLMSTPFTISE